MPGSGNVIGGQTIYVKLRGYTPEQMWIASPDVLGGLKMANGENPKRAYGGRAKAPGTRMKVAALQRSEFLAAKNYLAKWDAYRKKLGSGEKATAPDVDLAMEPLVEVLQHKRTVHFHTHRADDILTVLRLKDEFNFELVIQHGTESYKVLKEIARHNVPVSMTIPDSPGGKAEVVDLTESCGADLAKAGIKVLVNTDDPVTESRFLLADGGDPDSRRIFARAGTEVGDARPGAGPASRQPHRLARKREGRRLRRSQRRSVQCLSAACSKPTSTASPSSACRTRKNAATRWVVSRSAIA